ncbi:transcription initiation factor TFIID subunit 11 [Gonapodya sp. JEL0774]|nr:transcription initiation factor TFIID subunit 11 [Gonapodya sp. JEL0774]
MNGGRSNNSTQESNTTSTTPLNLTYLSLSIPPTTCQLTQSRNPSALFKQMSEEEWKRMETYRRTKIPDNVIKKIVSNITGQTATKNVIIAISSAAKVFAGEIVERAKEAQKDWSDTGQLRPDHLREAYRRYREEQEGSMAGDEPKNLFG